MGMRTLLIREDGTFYEARFSLSMFSDFETDWESFKMLRPKAKEIILDTLREMYTPTPWLRYHNQHIEDYTRARSVPREIDCEEE